MVLVRLRSNSSIASLGEGRAKLVESGSAALRVQMARGADCDYLALHDMNHTTPQRRATFIGQVQRHFGEWD